MEINRNNQPISKVGFRGYQNTRTSEGANVHKFNYPFDYEHWDCAIEFFKVRRNNYNYTYEIVRDEDGKLVPFKTIKLDKDGTEVDFKKDLKLSKDEYVAYRYKLTHSDFGTKYAKDDDVSMCGDGCNLISTKSTTPTVQGSMVLCFPDSFNPGYVYAGFNAPNTGEIVEVPTDDLDHFSRTFTNKAGGTFAGMQKEIPHQKAIGIKRIIPTPGTGGDNRSGHYYWIKRMFQTASNLGNINDYDSYHKELFKNGIGYISDSAYTSQGNEGVNFVRALKWMNPEDKPYEYYMFRMQGLMDTALGIGVVPQNMENLRHKLINSPFRYIQDSNGQVKEIEDRQQYNPDQPTFIQIYDDSMVTDEQRTNNEIIGDYGNKTATTVTSEGEKVENLLAINTHDDTIMNNVFEIDPYEYSANIRAFNELNNNRSMSDKIKLNSPQGTLIIGKFSGFDISKKDEGGSVTWNSNTDMQKLSYVESDYDTKMLESIKNPVERQEEERRIGQAHAGNRDMLVDCLVYWTRHERNLQTEYTAKTLGKLGDSQANVSDRINKLIYDRNHQELPDETALNSDEVENIINNDYELTPKETHTEKALLRGLMETPLDSFEFADDTVGALSSPFLSKRSLDFDHIGISRYDAMYDDTFSVPEKFAKTYNKMNNVFKNEILDFAINVLKDFNEKSDEKIFDKSTDKLTEYGQYIVPLIAGDIAKYSFIKSLQPNAETKILKDGTLIYDYNTLNTKATLKNIGINGDSQEDEANQIIDKVKYGVKSFNKDDIKILSSSFLKRFEGTNGMSFRFAEAMVGKAGLGLGHRIDAAKDIADMDAVMNMEDKSDNQFAEIIEIYSPAIRAIKAENPQALIVAEFTDLYDTMAATYGKYTTGDNAGAINYDEVVRGNARFNPNTIARTLIFESGMNTEANYSHFFTAGLNTFGKDFVNKNGIDPENQNQTEGQRLNLLSDALSAFADMPLDYKRNAYTFGGNHDKPRMTECFGLDMALFHCNLNDRGSELERNHRKTAYMILNDILFEDALDKVNPQVGKTGWDIINNDPEYFNNVSPMAIAKADWLRSSIGIANNIITNERLQNAHSDEDREEIRKDSAKIFAAYSKSIRDVVNGEFYLNGTNQNDNKKIPDNYKKILEKDGFGAKDVLTAFSIVTQQAKEKYGLKDTVLIHDDFRKSFDNLVEEIMVTISARKTAMYNQMIFAITGNPTIYAGDEYAMTGYEEKNHNVYLQNRNVIPRHVSEEKIKIEDENGTEIDIDNPEYKPYIAKHKKTMDGIVSTRRHDITGKLAPLNGGTMFVMEDNYGHHPINNNGKEFGMRCPTVLSQSSDGSMVLTVFNYNGISLENPLKGQNIQSRKDLEEIYETMAPKSVSLESILLRTKKTNAPFDIPTGLRFRNIDESDRSYYETTRDDKGVCRLVRRFDGDDENTKHDIWIASETAPEGVLRLYYQPDEVVAKQEEIRKLEEKYTTPADNTDKTKPSFKGGRRYYNNQYRIVNSDSYNLPKKVETGSNLSIESTTT